MEKIKKIVLACDHAGFAYKEKIKKLVEEVYKIKVHDFGAFSEESIDYPDVAHPFALSVENNENEIGIILCGSGNGVCITVNKHKNVRGALCWNTEIAELARLHNNANVLCLPARFITIEKAVEIVNTFLKTEFEGGRHLKRVNKINL